MKEFCEMCGDKAYREVETPDGITTMCKGCHDSYMKFDMKDDPLNELYNYIMNNAYGKKLSLEKIMEEFSLTRNELLEKIHILNKERGMPIRLAFDIKKGSQSEKTICKICKQRQGIFRAIEIDKKNKTLSGIFVCESCYRDKEKFEKFVEDLKAKKAGKKYEKDIKDLETKQGKDISEEDLVKCPACKNKTLLWFPDSNFGHCINPNCAKNFKRKEE